MERQDRNSDFVGDVETAELSYQLLSEVWDCVLHTNSSDKFGPLFACSLFMYVFFHHL